MRRSVGPALVLLLLAAGLPPLASPQGSGPAAGAAEAPWWPDASLPVGEFRKGWNLRIPLVVSDEETRRAGAAVQVHLDLAQSLIEGGWPDRAGVPASFMTYPESVRLVEYDGWEEVRGEVPFLLHATWLEPDQRDSRYDKQQTGPFHGQRNPLVTLEWRLTRDLPMGQAHHYMVYLDIENNAGAGQEHRKTAPAFDAHSGESLDSLYWVGAGTTVYGHSPHQTGQNTMMVISTQADTNVEVHTYRGRSTASLDERQNGPAPTFNIPVAGQPRMYSFGLQTTHFRVEADKPVVVMTYFLDGTIRQSWMPEFVPSREGGLLGWSFDVPEAAAGVYLIRPPGGQGPATSVSISGAVTIPSGCEVQQGNVVLRNIQDANGDPRVTFCRVAFNTNNQPETIRSIRLQSGDPILVQFISRQGFLSHPTQVPSALGSPVGTTFHASAVSGQSCDGSSSNRGGFQVAPWEQPAIVDVVARAGPQPVFVYQNQELNPPGPWYLHGGNMALRNGCPSQGAPARDTNPYSVEAVADVAGQATGPIQVQSGGFGGIQSTPFGGRHGMEFQLQGPYVVYNYYPTTRIEVTQPDGTLESRTFGPSGVPREFALDQDDVTLLRADKPVSVFPLEPPTVAYARFHSVLPDFITPDILPGQFRGYLLEAKSSDGTDPVFLTGLPGQDLSMTFRVRNLGRWDGAPLADTVILSARVASGNWDGHATVAVGFDQMRMTLEDNKQRSNRLTLRLPDDIPSDTQLTVTVRARSEGNEQMFQEFTVVVLVRQTFGVEMWFGTPTSISGPHEKELGIQEGQQEALPFVIRNTGSNTDSFDVRVGHPGGGWDARITDALGNPLSRVVDIPPGAQVGGILHIRAPEVPEVTSVMVPISAVSATSPLASDLLTLFADLALHRDMELRAEQRSVSISPGETRRFNITLHNTGEAGLSVRMDLDAHLPPGWAVEFAGLGHPSQPPVSIGPNDEPVMIPIDLTAPADAVADSFVSFLLRAEAQGVTADARTAIALTAVVERTHLLEISPAQELSLRPGSSIPLDVRVKNVGNVPDEVRIEPVSIPAGWNLTGLDGGLALDRGQEGTLSVGVEAAPQAAPGPVVLTLQARSGGPAFQFQVPVLVQEVHEIVWRGASPVLAQPGDEAEATLFLENHGNVGQRVTLQATGPWQTVLETTTLDIPPGSVRTLRVAWDIPADAPADEREIRVTARAESGPFQTLALPVRVIGPRLEADEVVQTTAPRDPGSVGTVVAVLRNPGQAPVRDAEVRLVGQDTILDKVHFQSVGANGTVVAPLRWTAGAEAAPDHIEWGHWLASEFRLLGSVPMPEPAPGAADDRGIPSTLLVASLAALLVAALRRRGGAP